MTINRKLMTSLVLSAGILTAIAAVPTAGAWADELVTNGPQFTAGDRSGSWSAQRNVRASQRYEALVQTNPGFRANRVRRECGPIADPEMRADCLASFGQSGSSSR
jgi:predicted ribosomally synthesized peptide with SipW-like signal peptide